jgi:hypothetical protein
MAKRQTVKYMPTGAEIECMNICLENDLAYILKPFKTKYHIIKYQISNYKEVFYLKENDIKTEFTEYDALKKIMELYKLHSKRFK